MLSRVLLPGMVRRQVEFASTAGDDGAPAYAHQPLVFADVLPGFSLRGNECSADAVDFGQYRIEALGLDIRVGFKTEQCLSLPFEFLQQIRLQVGSTGNLQHFKNRRQGDMVLERMRLIQEKCEFFVQIFQPQQGANTLVERVFVYDQNRSLGGLEWSMCDSDRWREKLQML